LRIHRLLSYRGRFKTITSTVPTVHPGTTVELARHVCRPNRLLTVKDARGIVFLTNQYDTNGRVSLQTLADSGTFQFAYTLDANGKVTQADVTDPRGHVVRTSFNANGASRSRSSVGSCVVARLRPAPGLRTRSAGINVSASSSRSTWPIVAGERPVARATTAMPP
jgi:YD repeat-containing protein